jgi:hypothetical protein
MTRLTPSSWPADRVGPSPLFYVIGGEAVPAPIATPGSPARASPGWSSGEAHQLLKVDSGNDVTMLSQTIRRTPMATSSRPMRIIALWFAVVLCRS